MARTKPRASNRNLRLLAVKQHGEAVTAKRSYVAAVVKQIGTERQPLAAKMKSWSAPDEDGNRRFEPQHHKAAVRYASSLAAMMGATVGQQLVAGVEQMQAMAESHTAESLDALGLDVDPDDLDVDDEDYDPDDAVGAFVADRKNGVLSRLMTIASAVLAANKLSDFGRDLGMSAGDADEADANDVSDLVLQGIEYRAQLYMRSELSEQYGDRKQSAMERAVDVEPTLKKQWQTIDPGCPDICHPADQQVVEIDEMFVMGDESECDEPPSHPNCDCVSVPYTEHEESEIEVSEEPGE